MQRGSMHPIRKFMRHESNSNLQSRLKTRKWLGVGETDDGEVYRSKLSQMLGPSEQLSFRCPRGLRFWQLLQLMMFASLGVLALLFPQRCMALFQLDGLHSHDDKHSHSNNLLGYRLMGACICSTVVSLYSAWRSCERERIRASLQSLQVQLVAAAIAILLNYAFSSALPSGATHEAGVCTASLPQPRDEEMGIGNTCSEGEAHSKAESPANNYDFLVKMCPVPALLVLAIVNGMYKEALMTGQSLQALPLGLIHNGLHWLLPEPQNSHQRGGLLTQNQSTTSTLSHLEPQQVDYDMQSGNQESQDKPLSAVKDPLSNNDEDTRPADEMK